MYSILFAALLSGVTVTVDRKPEIAPLPPNVVLTVPAVAVKVRTGHAAAVAPVRNLFTAVGPRCAGGTCAIRADATSTRVRVRTRH